MSELLLIIIVFFSGLASLGLELAASRLVAPFFGSSLLIWANLIGLILIYLTAGYYIGGRWADRDPRRETLYRIVGTAGFMIGVLPFIAAPLLSLASGALETFDSSVVLESFVGTVLLFAVPVTLLGCVTPFAVRLRAQKLDEVGSTAGNLYALSTVGAILGVYLTTFLLIPGLGTRQTFGVFSLALLGSAFSGLWQRAGIVRALPYAGLFVIVVLLFAFGRSNVVKASTNLVYETESQYNFIQVVEDQESRLLTVNEGQAYQSAYHSGTILLGGYWDLLLLAPYVQSVEAPRSLLVIGLAAGTITKQYAAVYPGIDMDGVEIDPSIVKAGREYFAMTEPNLRVWVDDGRAFLHKTTATYDVIILDAYRQPYIPFHLASVEFFQELQPHLSWRGVVAVNAARTPSDDRLVVALAATMRQVFPVVIAVDHPNGANTILLASTDRVDLTTFREHLDTLKDPTLVYSARIAAAHVRLASGDGPVFTDDRSPIENLTHSMIFDYVFENAKQIH